MTRPLQVNTELFIRRSFRVISQKLVVVLEQFFNLLDEVLNDRMTLMPTQYIEAQVGRRQLHARVIAWLHAVEEERLICVIFNSQ